MEYFDFDGAALDDCHDDITDQVVHFQLTDDNPCQIPIPISGSEVAKHDDEEISSSLNHSIQFSADNTEGLIDYVPRFHVPAVSCDHCWMRKLQCLVIRDATPGCSSCKALFQECSFIAQGGSGIFASELQSQYKRSSPRLMKLQHRRTRRGRGQSPVRRGQSPVRTNRLTLGSIADLEMSQKSVQNADPMERWKHSPPEIEPASASAIANAVMNLSRPGPTFPDCSQRNSEGSNTSASLSFSVLRPSSIHGSARSGGSDISQNSVYSLHVSRSLQELQMLEKGVSRRRRPASTSKISHQKSRDFGSDRRFQCTFCTATFATKFDWLRHEKTEHLSLEKWVCSRFGAVTRLPSVIDDHQPSTQFCIFCGQGSPTPSHLLNFHSIPYCLSSNVTVAKRTFCRKDHLQQHLRTVHNCGFQKPMNTWRSTITHVVSRCGFCGTNFTIWEERVDHLTRHFLAGAKMAEWKGDWGLDAELEDLVENVALPRLRSKRKISVGTPDTDCREKLMAHIGFNMEADIFRFDE